MITALVVHQAENKREISKLLQGHEDWKVLETDDYQDALKEIQSGRVDALAVAAEISAGDCMGLVNSLHSEKPEANVYVMMDRDSICDRSKSIDRGFIYM